MAAGSGWAKAVRGAKRQTTRYCIILFWSSSGLLAHAAAPPPIMAWICLCASAMSLGSFINSSMLAPALAHPNNALSEAEAEKKRAVVDIHT